MTEAQWSRLQEGDMIRHKHGSGGAYIVVRRHPRIVAIRAVDVSNPPEWDVVDRDGHVLDG